MLNPTIPLFISTWLLKYWVSLDFLSISKYQVWKIKKSIWFRNWFLQATQAVKIKFELEKKSSLFRNRFFSQVCNKVPNWDFKNQAQIDTVSIRLFYFNAKGVMEKTNESEILNFNIEHPLTSNWNLEF